MTEFLSAALIVRDEERYLYGCLASIRNLVDEIVVVDTGSVDRSREIAAAHGARLSSHVWHNDFAAARNAAPARSIASQISDGDLPAASRAATMTV